MIPPDVPALVSAWRRGEPEASERLSALVYPELRRAARRCLARERPGHTLQATELVHEAWLRLFSSAHLSIGDRGHLMALMATQMRRVLVDYARRRHNAKGPGSGLRVSLDAAGDVQNPIGDDILEIHDALTELEQTDGRACRVVELRFFGGLLEQEAAEVLGISLATLKRDWTFARAWLFDRLKR